MSSILMPGGFDQGEMESKFTSTQKIIEEVNSQFKNSVCTPSILVSFVSFVAFISFVSFVSFVFMLVF